MRRSWRRIAAALIAVFVSAYLPVPAQAETISVGERVYVLGAVKNPGDFEFRAGMDVKQALELAGGLADNADPNGVMLIREKGEKMSLNIQAILEGREKVELIGGDTVIIKPRSATVETLVTPVAPTVPVIPPMRKFNVSITGEINQPGMYTLEVDKTDNLGALIDMAGGVTTKADLKHVRISSLMESERIMTTEDASSPSQRQTLLLSPEDAVFIPQTEQQIKKRRITLNDVYLGTVILYTIVSIFRD